MRIEILACLAFLLASGCPASDVLKAGAAVFSAYYIGTGMNQQPHAIPPFLVGIAFVAGSVFSQSPHGFAAAYLPYGTPVMMAMWWTLCSLMANSAALGTAARYGLLTVPAEAGHGFVGLVRNFLDLVAAGAMFVAVAGRRGLAAPLLAAAPAVGGHGDQEEDDIDAESADDDDDVAARDNFVFVRPPVAHPWAGLARIPVLGNNDHHNGVGEDVEAVYEDAADNGEDGEDEYVESYEDYNYIYSDEDDEEENVVEEVASNVVVVDEEVTSNDVVVEEVNWIDVVVDEVTSSDVLQGGTRGASGGAVYHNATNNNSAISSSQSTFAAAAAAYNPAGPMRSNNWSLSSNSNNSVPRLGSLTGNYITVSSTQVVAHSHALAAAPAPAPAANANANANANASSAFNTQVVAQSHALAAAANASANRFLPPFGAEPQQQPSSIHRLGPNAANASANRFLPPFGAEPQQLQPSSINQGLGLDAANASANWFLPPLGAEQQHSISSQGLGLDAAASANRFLPSFGDEQQSSNISHGLGLDAAVSATATSNVSAGGAEPTINDDEVPVRAINLQPATFVYNWGDLLFSSSNDNGPGSAQSPAAAVDSFASAPATLLPDGEKQGAVGPLVDDKPNPRKRKTRPEASAASSKSSKSAKSKVPEDDDDEAALEPPAKRHCPSTRFQDSPTLTQISDVTFTDEDAAASVSPASSTAMHKDAGAASSDQNHQEEEPAPSSEKPAAEKVAETVVGPTPTKVAAKKIAAKKPAAKKPAPKKASKPSVKAPKPATASAKQGPVAKKRGVEAVVDEAAKVPALRRSPRSSRRI